MKTTRDLRHELFSMGNRGQEVHLSVKFTKGGPIHRMTVKQLRDHLFRYREGSGKQDKKTSITYRIIGK